MNLPLPNLDDRTYADLVEEAISQISVECPEWTDHNPTDTGIILIELLAWLTEMTLYQVNQITDKNKRNFLSLLNVTNLENNKHIEETGDSLQSEIKGTLLALRRRHRAVTIQDYEQLVLEDWNTGSTDQVRIARVKGFAQRNLALEGIDDFATGHISLVVVPEQNPGGCLGELLNFLEVRKLLTTRLHIVEVQYVSISIEATLIIKDGALGEEVKVRAEQEMKKFFHPLDSGQYWEGKGWPFGRSIYKSEIYKLLDDLSGVDYVEDISMSKTDPNPSGSEVDDDQSEIDLAENQLVQEIQDSDIILNIKYWL